MGVRAASALVAALLAVASPAWAGHDSDSHSENTRLVSSLPLGGLGDIAFWEDVAVVSQFVFEDGSTDGFSVVDISDPARPLELSRFVCTGGGWDVSIWEHLVFLSVDDFTPTQDGSCAAEPGSGFAGIKIVSIADPRRPAEVGAIPLECSGSHTNTLVPDLEKRRLVLYASSLRYSTEPGALGCDAVIEVPLDAPASAKVLGALPGDAIEACHDVTAFLPRKLLAAACASELRIYDIAEPAAPTLLSVTTNPANQFQHSVAFSNDGMALVTGEEGIFYSGSTAACPGGTGAPTGALWFYDLGDPARPLPVGYHQLQRGLEPPSGDAAGGGCSAHNFNVVPTRSDRDVLVTAWYAGGMSAIDFTQPSAPSEIAHYQPALGDPERRAFYWSAYWYRDHVFATNGYESRRRTLDVYAISDPAIGETYRLPHLNAQTQEALTDAPTRPAASGRPPAPPACRPSPARLRIGGARRILRADVLDEGRRVRRLRARGRTVRVDLRGLSAGRYVIRVVYRDRAGRRRTLRRRAVAC